MEQMIRRLMARLACQSLNVDRRVCGTSRFADAITESIANIVVDGVQISRDMLWSLRVVFARKFSAG